MANSITRLAPQYHIQFNRGQAIQAFNVFLGVLASLREIFFVRRPTNRYYTDSSRAFRMTGYLGILHSYFLWAVRTVAAVALTAYRNDRNIWPFLILLSYLFILLSATNDIILQCRLKMPSLRDSVYNINIYYYKDFIPTGLVYSNLRDAGEEVEVPELVEGWYCSLLI